MELTYKRVKECYKCAFKRNVNTKIADDFDTRYNSLNMEKNVNAECPCMLGIGVMERFEYNDDANVMNETLDQTGKFEACNNDNRNNFSREYKSNTIYSTVHIKDRWLMSFDAFMKPRDRWKRNMRANGKFINDFDFDGDSSKHMVDEDILPDTCDECIAMCDENDTPRIQCDYEIDNCPLRDASDVRKPIKWKHYLPHGMFWSGNSITVKKGRVSKESRVRCRYYVPAIAYRGFCRNELTFGTDMLNDILDILISRIGEKGENKFMLVNLACNLYYRHKWFMKYDKRAKRILHRIYKITGHSVRRYESNFKNLKSLKELDEWRANK